MRKLLKRLGLALLVLVIIANLVYLLLPKGPRNPMAFDDPYHQARPMVIAEEYVVAAGTPWATQAAVDVLERGGNAYDAAAASLLVLNVTHGEAASFPSIAPLLIYDAQTRAVRSYIGAGTAPQAATVDLFRNAGFETIPDFDIRAQLIPASPDVIVALLRDYGTMSFTDISAAAILIAREGFAVHSVMASNLDLSVIERLGFCYVLFPYNCEVYLHGEWWRPLHQADRFTLPDLANTFEAMAQAEQGILAAGGSREEGLQAIRDYFYEGPLAEAIVHFHGEEGGLITAEDLAGYSGGWEEPITGRYGEYTIYTNGSWSQGIVVPMALQTLEGIDLRAMGHNSPEYIHTVVQAIELAQADRDAYVADPEFVDVPLDVLLSQDYAALRRAEISESAFPELPLPGRIAGQLERVMNFAVS
jgi:gamma-glutamyltranspeptidase/glutathione hydrolase